MGNQADSRADLFVDRQGLTEGQGLVGVAGVTTGEFRRRGGRREMLYRAPARGSLICTHAV